MHRQRRDTPLLYTPSIYIRSIICTVPIRERCWRNLSPGQVSTALLRCKRSSFDSRNSKLDWAADNAAIRRAKPVRQSNRVDPRYIKRKKYELICKIMAPATSPAFIKVTQVYRAARNSMEITLARDSFSLPPSLISPCINYILPRNSRGQGGKKILCRPNDIFQTLARANDPCNRINGAYRLKPALSRSFKTARARTALLAAELEEKRRKKKKRGEREREASRVRTVSSRGCKLI